MGRHLLTAVCESISRSVILASVTSTVGAFSGIDSAKIIDQFIALESRPKELAQAQIDTNTSVKTALLGLSAKLLSLQGTASSLKSTSILNARSVQISDSTVLKATASTTAALGSTQFRAVRLAQSQRIVSNGFANIDTTPVGAGTITIKQGGFVATDTSLASLNAGAGVPLGKIRITSRSGTQTTVDLTGVKSIGDVVRAINGSSGVGVTASVSGDRVVLTDTTGQTTTAISVAEVDGGTTGAALGLTGGTFAGSALTGTDVINVNGTTALALLNDGHGVQTASGNDFRVTLRDGSTIDVDLGTAATLQNVVDAINSDSENTGSLVASIDPAGNGLRLTDTSGGGGTLGVSALSGSKAAKDLGILGNEQGGGVLTGKRLLAGFNSVLLRNLNGGSGITTLGTVQFTDRSGATASVDFSSAGSLSDVVSLINNAGLGISATINSAGNGIKLTDTTGSTSSNLIIADNTGTVAADLLLTTNAATTSVNSGDLNQRFISESTRLERLNGGTGVQRNRFKITDSAGVTGTVDIGLASIKTVGDVITAINSVGVGVLASINSTGDGIVITDTAGGAGTLTITENGSRTAADLKILGAATAGQINGAYKSTITVSATDTVNDVVTKFLSSGAPINVSVTNDGTATTPFRVLLGSTRTGNAGRLLVDTGTTGFSFTTAAEGVDSLLQVGASTTNSTPLVFTSNTNSFTQVLNGVNVDLHNASSSPVTVSINQNNQSVSDTLQTLVNNFNSVLDTITTATQFNTTTNKKAVLFTDALTRQIQTTLYRVVSRTYGEGAISKLADLGVGVKGGRLTLDTTVLNAKLDTNISGVQDFLRTTSTGFADQLDTQLKSFTTAISGQIAQRVKFIDDNNETLTSRITQQDAKLAVRRAVLEAQFLAMEQAIGALKNQQTALAQLTSLAASVSGTSSSSN